MHFRDISFMQFDYSLKRFFDTLVGVKRNNRGEIFIVEYFLPAMRSNEAKSIHSRTFSFTLWTCPSEQYFLKTNFRRL